MYEYCMQDCVFVYHRARESVKKVFGEMGQQDIDVECGKARRKAGTACKAPEAEVVLHRDLQRKQSHGHDSLKLSSDNP